MRNLSIYKGCGDINVKSNDTKKIHHQSRVPYEKHHATPRIKNIPVEFWLRNTSEYQTNSVPNLVSGRTKIRQSHRITAAVVWAIHSSGTRSNVEHRKHKQWPRLH